MMHLQRVESLWDMLLTYARAFTVTSASLEFVRMRLSHVGEEQVCVGQGLHNSVNKCLEDTRILIEQMPPMFAVLPPLARLKASVDGDFTANLAYRDLEHLQRLIHDNLAHQYYYHVQPNMVQYYAHPFPYGENVFSQFPDAILDVEKAGQCLALGQGTACLFHLMRVMEAGLKVLGKALGITYAPSWESYLKQINKIMDQPYKSHSVAVKKRIPFYKEVSGDLSVIKFAWRNPTMHIVRHNSREEAEEVYKAVKRFMQRIADGPLPAATWRALLPSPSDVAQLEQQA